MKGLSSVPGVLSRKILNRGISLLETLRKVLDDSSRVRLCPKHSRAYSAAPDLNALEVAWWNKNAEIIAKTWEYDESLTTIARGKYLSQAADFFKKNFEGGGVVLELGCGSGWAGRYLAKKGLQIYGTDFSQSQIDLAMAQASASGLDNACSYNLVDSTGWPKACPDIAGVFIHAFLHHLDESEIEKTLYMLKDKLKKGTRVWIYEPACYASSSFSERTELPTEVLLLKKISESIINSLFVEIRSKYLFDINMHEKFSSIQQEANNKGWYLSPKEVPIDIDWFTGKLSGVFTQVDSAWKTIFLIGWLYTVNLITDKSLYASVCKDLVPFLVETDEKLSDCRQWLRDVMVAPMHAFHVWECIV